MDWNKTKTIFIIVFLVLDCFLVYQFMEKRNSSQLDVILETTIEEQLEANGITYVELPKEVTKAAYVSGKSRSFTAADTKQLSGQRVEIKGETKLKGTFTHPVALNVEDPYQLREFLQRHILNGEQYAFWSFDKQEGTVTCYQVYDGKMIYGNENSKLVIHVNEQKEALSYEQTMLDDLEKYERKQDIVPAIKAIETLYRKGHLQPGDRVTKVELGYYGLVQFTASQVLTPTWHIVVNRKEDYFVNAFEGQVINEQGNVLE
ncbi:transcriptional regulator [Geobacillus subterraneus]|uniref:Transcriptional regulator n=2 Tax=Geobacillus TaxID=129337 RepID=A0ABN4NJV6_9BACL|nr:MULTISPECIES: two-component system regulatory protein YycI [Geobacillus]AMX84971.1 transcriptional regulator [Geobacillus subterraneus]KZS25133.1 transcriptional regulator [Geobacillus subterraneus]OXB85167.1 transcriptional regulator [Geobacillus uzenensis]QIZ66198.1 transcriptional regulator [Geobacillus subterraneus]WPZ18399.1 two-component system regulatory protein YycI [Geobacillus subterraneus]